jgi:hypothetical protein
MSEEKYTIEDINAVNDRILPRLEKIKLELVDKVYHKINEIIAKTKGTSLNTDALQLKMKFEELSSKIITVNPSGGRLMTRKYCKKTPCKKMGFTQRASCRPWKNCYRKSKK